MRQTWKSRRLFLNAYSRSLSTSLRNGTGLFSSNYFSPANVLRVADSPRLSPFRPHQHHDLHPFSQSLSTDVSSHTHSGDGTLATDWEEHDFTKVAEGSLELIGEIVSASGFDSPNAPDDFDVDLSQGVLTIHIGHVGTYVLNTQTPNRQIWMSSPTSGPWRYGWHPNRCEWVSSRDGHCLSTRLSNELCEIFGEPVKISFNPINIDK